MGLFGSIKTLFTEKPYESKITKVTNTALTLLTKPVQSFTGRFEQAYAKTSKEQYVSLASQGATNALLVTTPFTSTGKTLITKAISSLSPTTKLALGAGAVAVVPAVISNPQLLSYLPEPSNLPAVGSEFGDFTREPTLEKAITIIKNHPYLDAVAIIALVGATGKAASLLATAYNSYALNKNTRKEIDEKVNDIKNDKPSYDDNTNSDNGTPTYITINNIPPTPPTISAPVGEQVKETTKKPLKKKAKKKTTKKKAPKKKAKKKTTKKKAKKKTIKRGKS